MPYEPDWVRPLEEGNRFLVVRRFDGHHRQARPAPAPEATLPTCRYFSKDDKLRILLEAERCMELGYLSALLRKEGIFSSSLSQWHRLCETRGDDGLLPKKSGRRSQSSALVELERLKAESLRLQERLKKAEFIIEVQKSVQLARGWPDEPT